MYAQSYQTHALSVNHGAREDTSPHTCSMTSQRRNKSTQMCLRAAAVAVDTRLVIAIDKIGHLCSMQFAGRTVGCMSARLTFHKLVSAWFSVLVL